MTCCSLRVSWRAIFLLFLLGIIVWLIFGLVEQHSNLNKAYTNRLVWLPAFNKFGRINSWYTDRWSGLIFIVKLDPEHAVTISHKDVELLSRDL